MNPQAYRDRKPNRPGKLQRKSSQISRDQEKRVAERLKGRTSRNSGAGRIPPRGASSKLTRLRVGGKGDVPTELLLIECKTTEKQSISLQQGHLIKITREAVLQMKSPAMVLSFPVMPSDVDEDWLVIPLGVWEKMNGKLDGNSSS